MTCKARSGVDADQSVPTTVWREDTGNGWASSGMNDEHSYRWTRFVNDSQPGIIKLERLLVTGDFVESVRSIYKVRLRDFEHASLGGAVRERDIR